MPKGLLDAAPAPARALGGLSVCGWMLAVLGAVAAMGVLATYRWLTAPLALTPMCIFRGIDCPGHEALGYVHAGYEGIRDYVQDCVRRGDAKGFSVAAFVDGELVVNLAAGRTRNDEQYTLDHLQMVFSAGKVVESIVFAWLVDRHRLSYDDLVTKHWPEFGQGGKENVTIADVLRHEGGVPFVEPPFSRDELRDLDLVARRVAAQPHYFGGEQKRFYHASTRGFVLQEIARRADAGHRTMDAIVQQELAEPLRVDFHWGAAKTPEGEKELFPRVTPMISDSPVRTLARIVFAGTLLPSIVYRQAAFESLFGDEKTSPWRKSARMIDFVQGDPEWFNRLATHQYEFPSFNGVTNAHGLAILGALMANGGRAYEHVLLGEATTAAFFDKEVARYDGFANVHCPFTQGGVAHWDERCLRELFDLSPSQAAAMPKGYYGWNGHGGAALYISPEHRIVFAYAVNTMDIKKDRAVDLWRRLHETALAARLLPHEAH